MSEVVRKDFTNAPLCLSGRGVAKIFGMGNNKTTAVDYVDFDFHEGEFVSIVGESGSGKTTLSKMLLGLLNPSDGEILFQGKPRDISTGRKRKEYWKGIQAIFQDPFSSFNTFQLIRSSFNFHTIKVYNIILLHNSYTCNYYNNMFQAWSKG